MMYIAKDGGDRAEYGEFLKDHPMAHFAQSPEWAGVKTCWKNELVLVRGADGAITAGVSALVRRVPVFGNLIYCPRGPVFTPGDTAALTELTEGLRELMERYHAVAVTMEPDVREENALFRRDMKALGWRFRAIRDARDTVQPRSVFRLDLRGKSREEIMAGFHKKLRYNIRLAQRRGVEISDAGREGVEDFAALMEVTARRDGFLSRDKEYFYRIFDALGPERTELLLAKYEGRPVAGGLFVNYGHKTWYLYGASADEFRNVMPCHLLHWEAVCRALGRGDRVYDLRGFLEITDISDPKSGLYRFKRQFGGELVSLIGEVFMTNRPLSFALYQKALRLARALTPLIARLRRKKADQSSDKAQ